MGTTISSGWYFNGQFYETIEEVYKAEKEHAFYLKVKKLLR